MSAKIKKLIEDIKAVAEAKEKTAYKVVVMYDSIDETEKVEIYDFKDKKVAEFEKEIVVDENTVDEELELSSYTIEYEIANKILDLLEKYKNKEVIEDYDVVLDSYEKSVANHNYLITDIDVALFFNENEDLDKISEAIREVLKSDVIIDYDLHSIKFTLTSITSVETVTTYYLANNNITHVKNYTEYLVDKTAVLKIVDYFLI